MDEFFYEILTGEDVGPYDPFLVMVRRKVHGRFIFHDIYYKEEFMINCFFDESDEKQTNTQLLQTLNIARDELLERGLLNE